MTVATPTDVQNRLGRPLLPYEEARVEALLQDIEAEIHRLAPDRLTDPQWRNAVISVECSVCIRVARLANSNTNQVPQSESIGFPNNPTYQQVQLYRSDKRTLGIPLVESVKLNGGYSFCPTPEGWDLFDDWCS